MAEIGNPVRGNALGILLLMCAALPARAQDDDPPDRPGIPVVGRPVSHFYGAAGSKVKIRASVDRDKLSTDEWLSLKLTIFELKNANDVEKPSLKALPEFKLFQVDESKNLDPPTNPKKDQRIFEYRLRPITTAVTAIPEVAFCYYDHTQVGRPNHPQDKFPKTLSNSIRLRVTAPAQPAKAPPTPLAVPDFAENLAPDSLADKRGNVRHLLDGLSRSILFIAPLAAIAYVAIWRRLNPDAAKLARLKRHRAVRRALHALNRVSNHSEEAAHKITQILLAYLHERFDLPVHCNTTPEVADFLRQGHFAASAVDQVESCLRTADSLRYAPAAGSCEALVADGQRTILALEDPA